MGKLQGHTNGAWLRESCFWAQNYRWHPSLTFNQRVLIRGRGASQHSQLWPDLVNPLLLNLERGVVRRWGQREKSSPMQSLGSSGAHQLASVQACSAQASRPPLELGPRQSLGGSHMRARTSPFSLRILRLNSLPSKHRKSSPGWIMPHLMAMARAVLILSPVTMRTVIPARWHLRMASGTCTRG